MDGLILWLDATDIDGDGERDSVLDKTNIPLWVDKSRQRKICYTKHYRTDAFL